MSVLALCKFTPLGFETAKYKAGLSDSVRCKFTPLGFETTHLGGYEDEISFGVNLPRWGLKQ